jgi:hypothetical protein
MTSHDGEDAFLFGVARKMTLAALPSSDLAVVALLPKSKPPNFHCPAPLADHSRVSHDNKVHHLKG